MTGAGIFHPVRESCKLSGGGGRGGGLDFFFCFYLASIREQRKDRNPDISTNYFLLLLLRLSLLLHLFIPFPAFFLATPHSMQDLNLLTREPMPLTVEAWSLNHWTPGKFLIFFFFFWLQSSPFMIWIEEKGGCNFWLLEFLFLPFPPPRALSSSPLLCSSMPFPPFPLPPYHLFLSEFWVDFFHLFHTAWDRCFKVSCRGLCFLVSHHPFLGP